MLEVYFGNDTIKVREKALSVVDEHRAKGAVLESLSLSNMTSESILDAAAGSSLFGESLIYLVDTPSQKTEAYEALVAHLSDLSDSVHTFIVIEQTLLAAEKKKFTKHADTIEEFKTSAPKRFNTFSMADALAKKDKRTLWLLFNEAKMEGIADEEIIGILWWQLKSLRLAKNTDNPADSGMKEWPYNKAKQSLKNFKDSEVNNLSDSLLKIYHDARAGKTDLSIALEKWLLSI